MTTGELLKPHRPRQKQKKFIALAIPKNKYTNTQFFIDSTKRYNSIVCNTI